MIDNFISSFESQDDALFRAWGSRVSQAFAACGLIKTADTGQIDFTTVVRAGISNNTEALQGFEIYRFDDALQATKPVFIKVEYGFAVEFVSTTVIAQPVIIVSASSGTNGAGTLTGLVSARHRATGRISGPNVSGPTVTRRTAEGSTQCYFCGDKSSISFAWGVQATSQQTWFASDNSGFTGRRSMPAFMSIERTRNGNGTPNGDGLVLSVAGWHIQGSGEPTGPVVSTQILSFTNNLVGSSDSLWPITWMGGGFGTANFGGDIYYQPFLTATPKPQGQMLSWLGTWKNDVPLGSVQTITIGGVARSYISCAGIAGVANSDNVRSWVNSNTQNGALMMRYE